MGTMKTRSTWHQRKLYNFLTDANPAPRSRFLLEVDDSHDAIFLDSIAESATEYANY